MSLVLDGLEMPSGVVLFEVRAGVRGKYFGELPRWQLTAGYVRHEASTFWPAGWLPDEVPDVFLAFLSETLRLPLPQLRELASNPPVPLASGLDVYEARHRLASLRAMIEGRFSEPDWFIALDRTPTGGESDDVYF
jgi:hypothetical protein